MRSPARELLSPMAVTTNAASGRVPHAAHVPVSTGICTALRGSTRKRPSVVVSATAPEGFVAILVLEYHPAGWMATARWTAARETAPIDLR